VTSENPIENKLAPNTEGKIQEYESHPDIPVSAVPTSTPQDQPAQYHCEIACKTEKDRWDKTKPYVEGAGVVLLAIYTFYTIKMYSANRQAADAATSAAITASSSLEEFKKTAVEAANNEHLRLRAQLVFQEFTLHQGSHRLLTGECIIKNVGLTPATNIRVKRIRHPGRPIRQTNDVRRFLDLPPPIANPARYGPDLAPGNSDEFCSSSIRQEQIDEPEMHMLEMVSPIIFDVSWRDTDGNAYVIRGCKAFQEDMAWSSCQYADDPQDMRK
jgi:hypothetical protein